ncbi:hypothetical protein Fmac_032771 [Flemingia macrophylla]|uniref:Uncharacterized protein n=1 Tax=Flemingia macrophylla TaxID=520843 RepID=A0ABD1L5V3_9FABA
MELGKREMRSKPTPHEDRDASQHSFAASMTQALAHSASFPLVIYPCHFSQSLITWARCFQEWSWCTAKNGTSAKKIVAAALAAMKDDVVVVASRKGNFLTDFNLYLTKSMEGAKAPAPSAVNAVLEQIKKK